MPDNDDGLDHYIEMFACNPKKPAAPQAVSVDIPATEPLFEEPEALANGEAAKPKQRRSRPKEPVTIELTAEPAPDTAGIDGGLALVLLKHLGVELTKHRDGTFTGAFGNCTIITPSFRCKVEKTNPLELLRHCWEGDSRRCELFDEPGAVKFEIGLLEQIAEMEAARAERASATEPETETDEALPPAAPQQEVARPLD
jgi:hypothetical protein